MTHRSGSWARLARRRGRRARRPADALVARLATLALVLGVGLPVLATTTPAAAADPDLPLSGRVTGPGGTGVAGAVVAVYEQLGEASPVATATTNADGVYGFADLRAGEYDLVATPRADDPQLLASASSAVGLGSGTEVVDLSLAVSNVRGVVTRSDGSPAPGAAVETEESYDRHLAVTYDDGSFRLALDQGAWRLVASPPAVNPSLDVPASLAVQAPATGEVVPADIELKQPNLRGTVHAPDGSAVVAGATVTLLTSGGSRVSGARMLSRSDGSYGFSVPEGSYRLKVEPALTNIDGWVENTGEAFTVGAGAGPASPMVQDVALRGPSLTGVVRTPDGEPVRRAFVAVWHPATRDLMFVRSDATGHYGAAAPPGDVEVTIYKILPDASYLERTFALTVPADGPLVQDLYFSRPNVTGRVVTADGLPVRNATVQSTSANAGPDTVAWSSTDGGGRFGLLLDPGTSQRLVAEPPESLLEGTRTAKVIEVPGEGATDVEIVLGRPVTPAYDIVPMHVQLGTQPAARTRSPVISADGNVVAVEADHGFVGCDCGERRLPSAAPTDGVVARGVVLHDRAAGSDELLAAPDGTPVDPDGVVALDATGGRVAFVTSQNGLVAGDDAYDDDAFVLDRASGTLLRLAKPDADPDPDHYPPFFVADELALSDDGRTLVLVQQRENADYDDVYDLVVVSLDATGAETARHTVQVGTPVLPRVGLSGDGSTLAWTAFVGGEWGMHVLDPRTGEEDPVRPFYPGGGRWDHVDEGPSLSTDGRLVAYPTFTQRARPDGYSDIVGGVRLADRTAGTTRDVDLFAADGGPGSNGVVQLDLSGDGTRLTVLSQGPLPEDTQRQAWLVELVTGETTLVSRDTRGRPADRGVDALAVPDDPSVMALGTSSSTLNGSEGELVVLALGEVVPPEWPDGATLGANPGDIGSSSVRLRWSEATDNVAVAGYRVYRGGQLVGSTSAGVRQLRVEGLEPDTSYEFTVQAVDGRGSESVDGPVATVRTLPSDSTELRPLDVTTAPGGVVRLKWEAASGADEMLLRTYVGDLLVDEQTLAGSATTGEERGLAAGTAYTFQVFSRSGGVEHPFTERGSATIPALTLASVGWTVPTVASNVAARGSTAAITAVAETGRTVSVEVDHRFWYDDAHHLLETPRDVTTVVPLAEDPAAPGTYRGGFELVDGIARISAVRAIVSDGHGGQLVRASTRGPMRVSSDVVVTVDAPEGSLPHGNVQLVSATTGQSSSQGVEGGGVASFSFFQPAADYTVKVYDERGRVAAERRGLVVRDGLASEVTLRPTLPASLEVWAVDADGAAVPGARTEVRDLDTGDWVGGSVLDGSGRATIAGLQEGQRVELSVHYPRQSLYADADPQVLTLTPGANRVDLVARPVPRARLTGVVTYDDGSPAEKATVTLVQSDGVEAHTFEAVTGPDGAYSINGLVGAGTLAVRSGRLQHGQDVDLSGGSATQDVTLSGPREYDVKLRLFTRSPGSSTETGPIPLDWRTAVHFGTRITIDGAYVYFQTSPTDADGTTVMTVHGFPGQPLRWCIDGREPRLVPTCREATLGTSRELTLEMHAEPATALRLRAVDAAGAAVSGVTGRLYRVGDAGRELVADRYHWSDVVSENVPGAGEYEIDVTSGELSGRKGFAVTAADTELDLGTVVLRRAQRFAGVQNAVTPNRREVLPGGVVEMRASWRNVAATAVDGVVARIAVPANTQLVPDSLLRNGQVVAGNAGPGYVDVDLGTIAAGAEGTLRYRLRTAVDATGSLAGQVDMRYGPAGDVTSEALSPATVRIAGVSISGPAQVSSNRLPVSGRAPAGSVVTLLENGAVIGQGLAGPGGFWTASVTLASQPDAEPLHRVVAETTVEGTRLFAEHEVRLDATRPVATKVSLYQLDSGFPNGRRFTFDPRDGVARFPFVFVPGQTTVVEVTFDEPGLVSRADVLIGSLRVPASPNRDGVFVARTGSYSLSGPIRLDYDAAAKPMEMGAPEAPDQEIRDEAPPSLAGFQITDPVQPAGSGTGPRTGAFTMSIPSVAGGSVRSTLTVTKETYTPTAADLASEQATGSPAWAVTSSRSGSTLSFSMVVPLSKIPGLTAEMEARGPSPAGRGLIDALRAAAAGSRGASPAAAAGVAVGVARVGYQLAFNGATTLDSLLSAFGAGDKYQKLADAVDAAGGCSPAKASAYAERAQNIAYAAAAGDIGGAIFNVGALVFGPATFGLGTVALGVLGWAMDKAIGYAIDQATEQLMNDIKGDADCKDDEDDNDDDNDDSDDDVADPTWIYDPSGFAFEGARSARIGGVTATLLTAPTQDGPWSVWNADWYGQLNPQATDNAGRYGWDVPEGWWKVAFSRDGYQNAFSRTLRVLPPHLDVDVSMVRNGFPYVSSAVLRGGTIEVGFDRLVRSLSAAQEDALSVVDAAGAVVPGTWTPTGATTDDDSVALQRGMTFTPTTAPAAGSTLTMTVQRVADYAGRVMTAPYSAGFTVPSTPVPSDPPPSDGEPAPPDAPTGVAATAGEHRATLTWTAPSDNGSPIESYVVTVLPSGRQVIATADATSLVVDGLQAGVPYTFTVTATNALGTGPASAPSNEVVPTAVAPETTLTSGPADGSFTTSRTTTLRWSTSDPDGATYSCTLDGRPRACESGEVRLTGLRPGSHTFAVAAGDADGDLDPTPATRTWTVPRNDTALAGNGHWTRHSDRRAYLGTFSRATDRGATLTERVVGARRIALVVTRGRHFGTVAVFLGKRRLGRYDLSAGTLRYRQVVPVASFGSGRSGTLRIVVTSRHKVVRIEGLGVATR